jgi:hypothetical protein
MRNGLFRVLATASAGMLMMTLTTACQRQQVAAVDHDADDIAGVVTSGSGPEAGVWVIAETSDFESRFARIVVTDEQGRYLVPDLPEANYTVWVRGYGLEDSAKVEASPGEIANLTARVAPDPVTAAQVYPAAHWYSMVGLPTEEELADIPGGMNEYLTWTKNMGCIGCHQLGQLSTRTISEDLGEFTSSQEAWVRRVQSGQAGGQMFRQATGTLLGLPFKYLADWTDRVAAGEVPSTQPARPAGVERNVVATVRDWASPSVYLHDLISTDRRNPTVNGHGPVYGAPELSTDDFPILDPVANVATSFRATVLDPDTPSTRSEVTAASPYWGDEPIWDSQANAHNPMIDQTGRVWYTARIRPSTNPDFCQEGSDHPSARAFPNARAGRQLAFYEPETGEYTPVDTCFGTHHLQFAEDANHTLWTSGGGQVVGWLNTRMYDETGDAAASQGWTPLILDTNGNGRRDDYVEPNEAVDPTRDKRINAGYYAIMPNPADGSIWGSVAFRYPGSIVRLEPGSNPSETALAEIYNVPLPGFGVRGADIDRNGVVWVSLGSGHLGEFDRSKCQGLLNGPDATGDHCPEGWTFHPLPGPGFDDLPGFSVESSYYTWVDQHNTSGLGANVPIATGNLFDGVHALVDDEFVTLRIPYPLGFYSKGFDGRIDDPDTGWKGRGLWVSEGDRTPWLMEGGKGNKPLVVHFQVRPNPLAK